MYNLRNLFLFLLILLFNKYVHCDLCDLCKCDEIINNNNNNKTIDDEKDSESKEINNNILTINCKTNHDSSITASNVTTIDLKSIIWPRTNNLIIANFNTLDIITLPKMPGHLRVTSLNFDNNCIELIDSESFLYFGNIEKLSLENNALRIIKKDMLKNLKQLKELNLSHNKLIEIDSSVFLQENQLEIVDLSYNKINKLSSELLNALNNVKKLNFEGNKLFTICTLTNIPFKIEEINLSQNKFTLIPSTLFNNLNLLKSINISMNAIINIDREAFINLRELKLLDISYNTIEEIQLILPESIEYLSLKNNQLKDWPLQNLPKNLIKLELQNNDLLLIKFNELSEIYLQELNVSNNHIQFIPTANYDHLKILDISNNELKNIPENLSNNFPLLEVLILDNNSIEKIEFVDKLHLKRLSLSYLPNLVALDTYAFTNIIGRRTKKDGNGTCVEITVSHCPQLTSIHPLSFYDVNLCNFDVSYNNISNLPKDLFADWTQFEDGINIQGNPFLCNCDAQWMLDQILISLYQKEEHQYLLHDLKCSGPGHYTGQRFIKYYKHIGAFCNANAKMRMEENPVLAAGIGSVDGKNDNLFRLGRPNFVTIIIGCAVVLIVLIICGVYLTIEQNKQLHRRNRRFDNNFI